RRPSSLKDVIDARKYCENFKVPGDPGPVAAYNLRLADLVVSLDPEHVTEQEARQTAEAFIGDALKMPSVSGSTSVRGGIEQLRQKLEKAKAKQDAGGDTGELSGPPSGKGWRCLNPEDPERRAYQHDGPPPLTVNFAKVSTGEESTWLSTTEVSVGLFDRAFVPGEQKAAARCSKDYIQNLLGP